MKRDPIKQAMTQYYNSVRFRKFKPRFFYHRCNICGQEFKGEIMYECSYHDDYFSMTHYFNGCSECFESKDAFAQHCYDNIILPKEAWEYDGKPCTPIVRRMMLAAESKTRVTKTLASKEKEENEDIIQSLLDAVQKDSSQELSSTYYENMPEDFKQAVNVIQQYCQFEECSDDCSKCPHPLNVIRCGDTIENGEENE